MLSYKCVTDGSAHLPVCVVLDRDCQPNHDASGSAVHNTHASQL